MSLLNVAAKTASRKAEGLPAKKYPVQFPFAVDNGQSYAELVKLLRLPAGASDVAVGQKMLQVCIAAYNVAGDEVEAEIAEMLKV